MVDSVTADYIIGSTLLSPSVVQFTRTSLWLWSPLHRTNPHHSLAAWRGFVGARVLHQTTLCRLTRAPHLPSTALDVEQLLCDCRQSPLHRSRKQPIARIMRGLPLLLSRLNTSSVREVITEKFTSYADSLIDHRQSISRWSIQLFEGRK